MIILCDPDARFQTRVSEHLGRKDNLSVVDTVTLLEKRLAESPGSIDVVILGPNLPLEEAFGFSRSMQTAAAAVSVVLVTHALTADVLQQALRNGVRDVLPASFTGAQLVETVARAETLAGQIRGAGATRPVAEAEAATDHKVITVFSSKGGCGKSFLASNLAVALANRTGEQVAMVDLDLQFGDLAIMLQLFPARTIFDVAQNLDRLDADALRGYLTPHRSNVQLLAAPLEPGLSETISADAVSKVIRLLRESFRFVVIDTPPSFTDHVLASLDQSSEAILMTSMDVPSIKNMRLSLQTLQLLGFGRERIRLVLNRADSKVGLTVQAVEKTLATTVDVSIPSSRDVSVSINRGTPLVIDNPRSPVVSSILKLLNLVGGDAVAEDTEAAPTSQKPPASKKRFGFRRSKELGGSET